MSQAVLPNSIDASTEITAAELQGNFVALRDTMNGLLEGGGGSNNNLKADGITSRELADTLLKFAGQNDVLQEGVIAAGDGKVTPGAGLVLNYAAGSARVTDDSGVIGAGVLVPVAFSGSTVTIGANASGNPRIDQIILTLSGWNVGTVSVLPGTASGGATLDNRTGAAALPSNAIRLADILMPNGFAGPFVQNTHIRDRRPWARGAFKAIARNTNAASADDYTTAAGVSTIIDAVNMAARLETSGNPVEATLTGFASNGTLNASVLWAWFIDGATTPYTQVTHSGGLAGEQNPVINRVMTTPAAGSHLWQPSWAVSTGIGTLYARSAYTVLMTVREIMAPSTANDGA